MGLKLGAPLGIVEFFALSFIPSLYFISPSLLPSFPPSLLPSFPPCAPFLSLYSSWLYDLCRGDDHEPVRPRKLAQSIGCGKNFRGREKLDTVQKVRECVCVPVCPCDGVVLMSARCSIGWNSWQLRWQKDWKWTRRRSGLQEIAYSCCSKLVTEAPPSLPPHRTIDVQRC